ncbi:MAG: M23 family metallopeptidase [Bacillota bacterium]
MFWDKKGKNKPQSINEFYQEKKYAQDYDWIDYYRPRRKKTSYGWGQLPGQESSGRRIFYRVVVVLSILALLFVVKETQHPVGESMRVGLRYILTTDWDVRPAMEKAVKYGLQWAGVDSQLDTNMPQDGMAVTSGKAAEAFKILIPVSGKVIREYGWNQDSIDDMDRFHPGIDIAASPGTPVKAAMPGMVKKVGNDVKYGKYILIDHGEGVYTLYAGLGNIMITEGKTVKAGETVADIAKAGDIKGGGLHFELREKGVLTDPLSRLEIPSAK